MTTTSTKTSTTADRTGRPADVPPADTVAPPPPPESAQSGQPDRTWTITTTSGLTVSGYLPSWADEDPTENGVPLDRLAHALDDLCHWAAFGSDTVRVTHPGATRGDGPPATAEHQILAGAIACYPYSTNPAQRIPVLNLQITSDVWMEHLDPHQLAEIIAALRARTDHLDHEILPALIAARADWTAHHQPTTPTLLPGPTPTPLPDLRP